MFDIPNGYWLFHYHIIALVPLAFYMLYRGLNVFRGYNEYRKNREEADRIFKQRTFKPVEEVIADMNNFINKLRKNILVAGGYFFLSFTLFFLSFFLIRNAPTSSPLWLYFLVTLVTFAYPIMILLVSYYDLKTIREDFLEKIIKLDCPSPD